ncbi:hypothetical protein [Rhodospirillum rubrum]|uniref:Uncharacterized protein n=2 Tax=Rhodospirillum rubrum TaxID=1085 RepID=Q2RU20_RHORT|nr:hypothetical protein [Rhodospirillum rubrum]ABC22375.1 hypothetical protein Rru_A1575 [Rhodospirillum rubrum ATCC 11170]MBK5953955.1 hypothetical protein [Rhodospirillum rubrum]QXG82013.1 hypothetical protein KUL73_08160 [Rhodospirillum rubrum]HAQ00738.1 hypothetical protein [Rhodospirillum rubrum]
MNNATECGAVVHAEGWGDWLQGLALALAMLLCGGLFFPAQAQDPTNPWLTPSRPSPEEPPLRKVLNITESDCRRLTAHYPEPGVAYEAGHDVNGRPVVGADLEDYSALTGGVERGFSFQIAIDPFAQAGMTPPAAFQSPSIYIGRLDYDVASGQAMMNGRPLDNGAGAVIAQACREHGRGRSR